MKLIVTSQRHMEQEAADEIQRVLSVVGDDAPNITVTDMSGILTVDTTLDPISVSKEIKNMLIDEPWTIRYCMRVIPIQETVSANTEAIAQKAVKMALHIIPKDATYKIAIEKRNSSIASSDIITAIADNIENKVSLDHADMTILVEIIGSKMAGVSVLHDSDIFSAEKTRRDMSQ